MVCLSGGREFQATDIRSDPRSDLAIIRIDGAGKIPRAILGDSDEIRVGDWTIAVGNPFGLGPSVTTGILSGKDR
ncbi:S1C family serine protease [Symmachiella dynata]|uniref:S1C family serine protease n=1 Tax=Symmachiella dynata TaxID=2527995 RepID=UPI0030EEF8D6